MCIRPRYSCCTEAHQDLTLANLMISILCPGALPDRVDPFLDPACTPLTVYGFHPSVLELATFALDKILIWISRFTVWFCGKPAIQGEGKRISPRRQNRKLRLFKASSMLPGMEGSLGLSNGPSTLAHTKMQRSVSSLRPRVQPDDLRSACSTVLYTAVFLI